MAFSDVMNTLREEEQKLAKQLSAIRVAMSALGSNLGYIATGHGRKPARPKGSVAGVRKRKPLSAKARKAISDAQKKRWAKQKAAAAKR
jgi:hypothetical protein